MAPSRRELGQALRLLEARGEIRGGRFVAGFVGEQFALPEAVEMLRRIRSTEPKGRLTAVSACDPLNIVGILTPGERVPAILGNRIVFRGWGPAVLPGKRQPCESCQTGGRCFERSTRSAWARDRQSCLTSVPFSIRRTYPFPST